MEWTFADHMKIHMLKTYPTPPPPVSWYLQVGHVGDNWVMRVRSSWQNRHPYVKENGHERACSLCHVRVQWEDSPQVRRFSLRTESVSTLTLEFLACRTVRNEASQSVVFCNNSSNWKRQQSDLYFKISMLLAAFGHFHLDISYAL